MPANLPPHYFETEKKLKTAATAEEKIAIYEELLSIIPKHKGTEKIQAQLKTKIAKCKAVAQKKSSTARHGASYKVEKSGAGQVVLVGPPNAGKSRLVKSLTYLTSVSWGARIMSQYTSSSPTCRRLIIGREYPVPHAQN